MGFKRIRTKKIHLINLLAMIALLFANSSAHAQIAVQDAFLITPTLDSPSGQHNAKVAFNGTDIYLIVWEEGANVWQNSNKQIYAARVKIVNGNPTVLDPGGIHLLNTTTIQEFPKVAYGGGLFMVAWQELSNATGYDIKGVRINSNGTVLDPIGISISAQSYNQISPDITYDAVNNRFFMVWADFRSNVNYQIYGARVGVDGIVRDPSGIIMVNYVYHYGCEPYEYVPYSPVIQNNGQTLLLAFSESRKVKDIFDMISRMYTLDGAFLSTVLDYNSTKISPNYPDYGAGYPNQIGIITDNTDYLWLFRPIAPGVLGYSNDRYYIQAAYVKESGVMPNTRQINIDKNKYAPAGTGVFADPYYFIFWEGIPVSLDNYNGKSAVTDYNIYASRVDKNGQSVIDYGAPIIISNSSAAELNPAVAKGSGPVMLVVYEEDNGLDYPQTKWVLKARLVSYTPGTDTADATPPLRFNGNPSGSIASGSTQADLSLSTNELATCRYAIVANTPYASMSGIISSDLVLSHARTITGLIGGGSYVYYIRCQDSFGNQNNDDFVISFSIAVDTSDAAAPVLSSGSPSGVLPSGTTQAAMSLSTDENATCKYATAANIAYSSMANSFTSTGTTTHSKTISGLANGTIYNYYIRCQDTAGNSNAADYNISFSVAASTITSALVQDGGITPEQISIFLPSTMPTTATATVRYKKVGNSTWIDGHPLFRIRPEFKAAGMTIDDGFAWTIFGLTPGTGYDMEVTTHDGVTDTVYEAIMFTRELPPAAGIPTKNIPAGSTSAQIQAVLDGAVAGDVIQLSNGAYTVDSLKISKSGTALQPIYIRGQSRTGAIIQDPSGVILSLNTCSNIVIENLTLQGSGVDSGTAATSIGISQWGGYAGTSIKENITIRNITISGVDRGIIVSSDSEAKQMLVYDNTLTGNNRWDQDYFAYGGSGNPGVGDGTPDVDQNIFWNDDGIRITGKGNAAFNNTIAGFGDALAMYDGHKSVGIHFYRNDIKMTGDDGIEADFATRNVTFYDNRITNAMTLVSCDPIWGGPFIAARNIGINIGRQAYKLNNTNTGMFFYNNTQVRTANPDKAAWAWLQPNNGPLRAWGFENNIMIYQSAGDPLAMEATVQDPIDFTHNSWYPDGRVWWSQSGGSFISLSSAYSALTAKTPVFSGVTKRHEDDNISEANPFVTNIVLGADHHTQITTSYIPALANGTAPKNSGTPIMGITDGFSGIAPDRGAIISGIQIPIWGDRTF